MLAEKHINSYKKKGYLHLKNVFSKKEIIDLRNYILQNYAQDQSQHLISHDDLLSNEVLENLILDKRIINTVKSILGPNIVYFGESGWNLGRNLTTPSVYHTDNGDRNSYGPDWETEDYPIIRVAIYLQDHSKQGGGPLMGSKTYQSYIKNMYLRVLYQETMGPLSGNFKAIPIEIGDLVIWNLRCTHAGGGLKLKFTNFPISKRLLKIVPKFMISYCKETRILVFGNFGVQSDQLQRYIKYLKTRTYQVKRWQKSKVSEKSIDRMRNLNIEYFNGTKIIKEEIDKGVLNMNKLNEDHKDLQLIEMESK